MSGPHIPDEIRRQVVNSIIDNIRKRMEDEKLSRHTQGDSWDYVMFTEDCHEVHLSEADAAFVLALADVRNVLKDEFWEMFCLDE